MSEGNWQQLGFGSHILDPLARELRRSDGEVVALTPKAFDLLALLLAHPGAVLGKETIFETLWPGRIVEENNITQLISVLRRTLDPSPQGHSHIRTLPGRGYQFAVPVTQLSALTSTRPAADTRRPTSPGMAADTARAPVTTAPSRWAPGIWLAATLVIVALVWLMLANREPADDTLDKPSTQNRPERHTVRSLAILPFVALDADSDPLLGLGTADAIVTRLSDTDLAVRPTASVLRYRHDDPLAAGRALAVDAVLTGSLQQSAGRVRLNVQLLSVPGGTSLWSDTMDDALANLFDVQDALAQRVGDALSVTLKPAGWDMRHGGTRDLEAFRLYNAAVFQQNPATLSGNRAILDLLDQATARDPDFGLAMADRVFTYCRMAMLNDVDARELAASARAASERLVQQSPQWYYAHVVRAASQWLFERDWAAAEASYRRALAMTDQSLTAHQGLAQLLSLLGRHDEAKQHARKVAAIAETDSHRSPIPGSLAAGVLAAAGDVDEANALISDVMTANPVALPALHQRGLLQIRLNDFAAAIETFDSAARLSQDSSVALAWKAYAQARAGDRPAVQALLQRLHERSAHEFVPATSIASIHAGLADDEETLDWLETALAQQDARLLQLRIDPRWQKLRDHPRFRALAKALDID